MPTFDHDAMRFVSQCFDLVYHDVRDTETFLRNWLCFNRFNRKKKFEVRWLYAKVPGELIVYYSSFNFLLF